MSPPVLAVATYVNGVIVPPFTWGGTGVLVFWSEPVDGWIMGCFRTYVIYQSQRFDDYAAACMAASLCSAAVA